MATDLNKVILIGRLTKTVGEDEYSFGYVGNGTARATLSLAVNRGKKNADGSWEDETSYVNVTVWGKTAENLKPYFSKGQQVCVSGFLKQDRWEKDGQKKSTLTVVAESVQLLGGKALNNAENGVKNESSTNYSKNENKSPVSNPMGISGQNFNASASDYPEDIPF